MRVLLVGEYSRLHLTLAEGLRELGHEVLLASDGDGHKQYARDVDLTRKGSGLIDTFSAFKNIYKSFKFFEGYDVVQIINPCFLTLSADVNRYFFDRLRKRNKKVFLGAFGDDSFWVRACMENKTFKYSEFFVDGKSTNLAYNKILEQRWIGSSRERLNEYIAQKVDGIVACLYEYYKSYEPYYSDKLRYIPLPVDCGQGDFEVIKDIPNKIRFMIGVDKIRSEYKGSGLMKKVLLEFAEAHPGEVEISIVESVSYDKYQRYVSESHVLLDQLYSYSPSMNPLQAMAQGKVVISGGEPEMYDLMGAGETNRPVINVYPTEAGIARSLETILKEKDKLPGLSYQSRLFVEQYHDSVKIARQYIDFWIGI